MRGEGEKNTEKKKRKEREERERGKKEIITGHDGEADKVIPVGIHVVGGVDEVGEGDVVEVVVIPRGEDEGPAVVAKGQGLHRPTEVEPLDQRGLVLPARSGGKREEAGGLVVRRGGEVVAIR